MRGERAETGEIAASQSQTVGLPSAWRLRGRAFYYLVLSLGIGFIFFAFVLSYMIADKPFHFEIVAVLGLAGLAISRLAKRFRLTG